MAEASSIVSTACGSTRTQRRASRCGARSIQKPRTAKNAPLAATHATWNALRMA
jgi:hypothetical protein